MWSGTGPLWPGRPLGGEGHGEPRDPLSWGLLCCPTLRSPSLPLAAPPAAPSTQTGAGGTHRLGPESSPAEQQHGNQSGEKQQGPDAQQYDLKAYGQVLWTEEQSYRHRTDRGQMGSAGSLLVNTGVPPASVAAGGRGPRKERCVWDHRI